MSDREGVPINMEETGISGIEAESTKAFQEEAGRLKRVRDAYRSLYRSAEFRVVLKDILRDLHFLEVPKSTAHVVLQSYAVVLLRKFGVVGRDAETSNIDAFLGRQGEVDG